MSGQAIHDVLEDVCNFAISRRMFPHNAGDDMLSYIQRWSALFQRITDIDETKVPLKTRKKAVDFVFQMFDLSGRTVVKKGRSFKAHDHKGDEACFERASLFVLFTECGSDLAKVVLDSVSTSQAGSNKTLAKEFARMVKSVAGESEYLSEFRGDPYRRTDSSRSRGGRDRGGYMHPRGGRGHEQSIHARSQHSYVEPGAPSQYQTQSIREFMPPPMHDFVPMPPQKRPYDQGPGRPDHSK